MFQFSPSNQRDFYRSLYIHNTRTRKASFNLVPPTRGISTGDLSGAIRFLGGSMFQFSPSNQRDFYAGAAQDSHFTACFNLVPPTRGISTSGYQGYFDRMRFNLVPPTRGISTYYGGFDALYGTCFNLVPPTRGISTSS